MKDLDGISLRPVAKNPSARLEREAICFHFPHYHALGIAPQGAVRERKYKLAVTAVLPYS